MRFVILDKEYIGGEEKQGDLHWRVLGDEGAISETHDIFSPVNPGMPRAFFFHPSCLTTLLKWGFPSPFQLLLFPGSRRTKYKYKNCRFLNNTLTPPKMLCLFAFGHHSHILMLSSEGTWRIHCGDSPTYLIYLFIILFNIFLCCGLQPSCLLC